MPPNCRICDAVTRPFGPGTTRVLHKYDVQYWRCGSCGFVQTEDPYWLEEAYASPITRSDIHYVYRNRSYGWVARTLIGLFYPGTGPYLDFGGGYGLFVRDMRDRGYDFYLLDRYTPNLFAPDFTWEAQPAGARAELITCFEVFEHVPDPHAHLEQLLEHSTEILIGTSLVPDGVERPQDWSYFSPAEGQHVSFHTRESLRLLGARHGLHLHSNGSYLHLLSKSNGFALRTLFPLIARLKVARLLQLLFQRPGLLNADEQALERSLEPPR